MEKQTYYSEYEARDVAWIMTQRSRVPVWVYPYDRGWQVTGRGDLVTTPAIMPPLPLFADSAHIDPAFHRGHRPRTVYRVAWTGKTFTQMHQQIPDAVIASVLRQDCTVVVALPRNKVTPTSVFVRVLRPLLNSSFLAVKECGYRHVVLMANENRSSALADIHDAIVMYQVLASPGELFRGVKPYGIDTRGEGKRICGRCG